MGSIGVWCTVGRGEYPLLRHTMSNLLAHEDVRAVVVVHTSHHAAPTFGELERRYPRKVHEYHRDFGEGLDVALEDGGYNQLAARNFALERIEEHGVDWLLQFDADEYFTTELISAVSALSQDYDVICTSYVTLLSETSYWCTPRMERNIRGTRMHHPHFLIWRSALGRRCELCPTSVERCRNVTRHACVSLHDHPYWRVFLVDEWHHFHLHCILGKQYSAQRQEARPIPTALPASVIDIVRTIPTPVTKGLV